MNDQDATDTSAGGHKASPGAGTMPVVPPPPARPPTSSLPVQPPAATGKPVQPPAATGKPVPPPPAGKPEAAPAGKPAPAAFDAEERKQTLSKIGFVVGGLAVLGLVIWWLATLIANGNEQAASQPPAPAATESASPSAQPTRSQLPLDGVGALEYQLGDCFENFDPEATESRVVACTAGHSAQLVAVHTYPEADSYPGIAALRQKGREICQGAELTDAVANYVLMQRNAYPSDTSWAQGDRRVDCYVTADKGNIITESLIP